MKHRPIFLTLFVLLFLCLVGVLVRAAPVRASTTITVNTTADVISDDGFCSLREAIRAANLDTASGATAGECPAGSGADTVILPSGIYTLTRAGANEDAALTGDLDITSTVTISGAGVTDTIVDGNGSMLNDRVIHVQGGPSASVTIRGITIRGGNISGVNFGGGIANLGGTLTLDNCKIISNTIGFSGGAVHNSGTLTITASSMSGNNGGTYGGGVNNSGTLAVIASTIFSNTAAYGGGLFNNGVAVVTSTSVTTNMSGGGIYNVGGVLTISGSTVSNNTHHGLRNLVNGVATVTNTSVSGNAPYGGISSESGSILTLTGSAVMSNTATQNGGGLFNSGVVTATNTTISGNRAGDHGGGIYVASGTVSVFNVTVTNNIADTNMDGQGDGGGVARYTYDGTINSRNTIIAANSDNSVVTSYPDCSGTVISQGYNLIQSTIGCTITTTTGDITNVTPLLGSLQANGGPTFTHSLLSGSPAIDAGDNATCSPTDQRGGTRPVDGNGDGNAICDIGAYEFGVILPNAWLYLPLIVRGP